MTFAISKELQFLAGHDFYVKLHQWACRAPTGVPHVNENRHNTFGIERLVVIPIDKDNDRIGGGAARRTNLFHSFQDFNVGERRYCSAILLSPCFSSPSAPPACLNQKIPFAPV